MIGVSKKAAQLFCFNTFYFITILTLVLFNCFRSVSAFGQETLLIVLIILMQGIYTYHFRPLLFLSSCCGSLVPYLSLCHCSLNQSAIGFLFIVRFSLFSSSGSFSTLKISSFISKFRLCCSE